ncbi:MAG: DUF1349 domain-containing protein [Alphaproteobacteria bacterium]
MLLDYLKDFEWENEPYDISFNENGMFVNAEENTDFWLNKSQKICKNNAHFFYTKKITDFECKASFEINDFSDFSQCGIMIKINENNVFKTSLMSQSKNNPKIGSSLTIAGFSDWAIYPLNKIENKIYYKIKKVDNIFFIFYSTDNINFHQIRQFSFTEPLIDVKIGAYFASPSKKTYKSVLKSIEIK